MRCKKINQLLYLRENELTPRERKKLQAHLAACVSCRLEKEKIGQQALIVGGIKQPPHLENPTAMTNSIMIAVRNLEKFSRRRASFFDRLLDVLARRTVRLGFAGVLALVIGLFVVQEILVLQRLDVLEQRLGQHDATPLLSRFAGPPKTMLSLFGKKEQVVIDKEVLDKLLQSYGELEIKNRLLLEMLEQQADRANIDWQDGLTEKELEALLQSKTVQQKLKEL